ncbi:MAG TPA: hypothetical protein DCR64_10875, partial [Vibrio sp.]|nr:hypothetical protein [Vibrio sp.]
MQYQQIIRSYLGNNTNGSVLAFCCSGITKAISKPLKTLLTSAVMFMILSVNSLHAYPAYSHSKALPHRSVIYFAPKEDSAVKEFL